MKNPTNRVRCNGNRSGTKGQSGKPPSAADPTVGGRKCRPEQDPDLYAGTDLALVQIALVKILRGNRTRFALSEKSIANLACNYGFNPSPAEVRRKLIRLASSKYSLVRRVRGGWKALYSLKFYTTGADGWFLREGLAFTSPSAGAVAVDALPDADDPNWAAHYIGPAETIECRNSTIPKFGALQGRDVIGFFGSRKVKITTDSLMTLATYIAPAGKIGWLKLQRTRNNKVIFACDVWVCAGCVRGCGKPEFTFTVLHSNLNRLFFAGSPAVPLAPERLAG